MNTYKKVTLVYAPRLGSFYWLSADGELWFCPAIEKHYGHGAYLQPDFNNGGYIGWDDIADEPFVPELREIEAALKAEEEK